jgi:hypothetical protein
MAIDSRLKLMCFSPNKRIQPKQKISENNGEKINKKILILNNKI